MLSDSRRIFSFFCDESFKGGYAISRQQFLNFNYAYYNLRPTSHVEMAIIVCLSIRPIPIMMFVDEYVMRRDTGVAFFPDHYVFGIEPISMPDTKRIIIFKEQIVALYRELSGMSLSKRETMERGFRRNEINIEIFYDNLSKYYKSIFSDNDVHAIYHAIEFYYKFGFRPYVYCSTVASRLEIL